MNNLQKVRDATIKANPEILELKFGCVVEYQDLRKSLKYPGHTKIGTVIRVSKNGHLVLDKGIDSKWTNAKTAKDVKIIGRTIRLADVLLAIQKIEDSKYTDLVVNRWGEFLLDEEISGEESKGGIYTTTLATWNLLKNRLEDQSPETLEFIANLL